MTEIRNVVIVGSGPSGYTAAIYAARAGLNPLVIAGSVTAGGALMNTTEVENFPGFVEGIQGPELMTALQAQAERFGAEIVFDDVTSLDLIGGIKTVTTGMGAVHQPRAVILAMGSAYRKIGLDDERRLSGKGVSWCATCDGFFFRGHDVVVVGGGDSAIEEATFLTRFANKVTIVHRRGDLRASKGMADRAKADPKIEFVLNSEILGRIDSGAIVPRGDVPRLHIRGRTVIVLGRTQGGVPRRRPHLAGLFLHGRHHPQSRPAQGAAQDARDV